MSELSHLGAMAVVEKHSAAGKTELQGSVLAHTIEAMAHDRELARIDRERGFGLRYLGDPILSTPVDRVACSADIPLGLVEAMRRIMHARKHGIDGVGIAANQCGCAAAIILAPLDGVETVMVNPRIVGRSEALGWMNEGCLSIPKFETRVQRHLWIGVEFEDESFVTHFKRVGDTALAPGHELTFPSRGAMLEYRDRYSSLAARQYEARVIQHECDHLAGKQITDHVSRPQRRKAERLVAEAIGR